MKETLAKVTWRLPDVASEADWVATIGSRLRCLLRHVSQGRMKHGSATWATELYGDAPPTPPRAAAAEARIGLRARWLQLMRQSRTSSGSAASSAAAGAAVVPYSELPSYQPLLHA